VHITDRPHPGRRLTCKLSGYASEPGVHVDYAWRIVGAGRGGGDFHRRTVGHGRTYRVASRDRDMRVACFVEASNDGGYIVVGADNRVVR
jgi:hypothetical protein